MSILDWIQTTAIVLGGLYALYEYKRFRRFSPKIQFEVDFDLYPIDGKSGNYLLNIELIVKNQGQVRMYFPEIFVGVKTLGIDDIEKSLNTKKQLKFGRQLVPKDNIGKPKDPWWVDSGVTQVFPYPIMINEPGDFIQVNTEFYYYKNIKKYRKIAKEEAKIRGKNGEIKEEEKIKKGKEKIRAGYHQASIIKSTRPEVVN